MLPVIGAFQDRHPSIVVEVRRIPSRQMAQELLLRSVDFGVLTFNPAERELSSLLLGTDELVLLVRPDHPLAGRSEITMEEMGRQAVIAHNDPSPARERVLRLYEQRHAPLNIRMSLPSLDGIKRAVEMGLGVALLPRRCAHGEIARGQLAEIRVPELRSPRQMRFVYRKDGDRSHAAQAFLSVAKAFVTSGVISSRRSGGLEPARGRVTTANTAAAQPCARPPRTAPGAAPSRPMCRRRARAARCREDRLRPTTPPADARPATRSTVTSAAGRRIGNRHQPRDISGRRGDTRQADRHRVREKDLGERLADDRLDAAPPNRLRRVLARRSTPEVRVHQQHARVAPRGVVERMGHAARFDFATLVLEQMLLQALERDRRRNRAGMMRSVSMSLPRTTMAGPVMSADAREISHGRVTRCARPRLRRRQRRRRPSPDSSAASGRSGCPAGP